MMTDNKDALARGAARASHERARRVGTPLIPDTGATASPLADLGAVPEPLLPLPTRAARRRRGSGQPPLRLVTERMPVRPVASQSPASAAETSSAPVPPAEAGPAAAPVPAAPQPMTEATSSAAFDPTLTPDLIAELAAGLDAVPPTEVDKVVRSIVDVLRLGLSASGISPDEVEQHLAHALAYVRRRLSGDFTVDEFGFDVDYTDNVYLPLLRPLYKKWFRVEVRGIENIPSVGGGLIVANHSGTIALDSLMTQVAVHDEAGRHLRMLGADFVFSTPVVAQLARAAGTTRAGHSDAEQLLDRGELVGVWPEGFKGIGKPFSERYKLQRFGRGGFVSAAVRARVPIVPCAIVGAEEIYPMLGNARAIARIIGAPYVPITPTFPLLGPLGLIPLPSKWLIEFGEPVRTDDLPVDSAEDPMLVFELTDRIRESIQQTLYSLLLQRRSVFF